jgi:hypothetical protein
VRVHPYEGRPAAAQIRNDNVEPIDLGFHDAFRVLSKYRHAGVSGGILPPCLFIIRENSEQRLLTK